jgi:gamma-glutamyltranspeptidase / glutathione hydrolase
MISASNQFAARAGVRMLERGGNAVDAALAAAATLCVVEPMSIGVGGDAFALVSDGEAIFGLDAAGPAPARAQAHPVTQRGPRSVTVPGAVAGWAALSDRFGRFGLDTCLADAIDAAEQGRPVPARTAAKWRASRYCPDELVPDAPAVGEIVRQPALAATLRQIAAHGPDAVYRGQIAGAIASASWLRESDLAAYRPRWVEPMRAPYRGHEVVEMPPPTQGVIALEALRLLDGKSGKSSASRDRSHGILAQDRSRPTLAQMVRAVALALEDGAARVRDGADVTDLLDEAFIARRRALAPRPVAPVDAGTSHLCVVDADRMAVSLIGSLFGDFGSGVLAPDTGIVLQNRGACFAVEGGVTPGRRPYHTIIPGMIVSGQRVHATFGVVGGHLQAQAHVQLVSALLDDGLDPQAALDRSRFRIDGSQVLLEEGLWPYADELGADGYTAVLSSDWTNFGCGQAIVIDGDVLLGGADPRMDGCAAPV